MSADIDGVLVRQALEMALAHRRAHHGLIHHTDQGRQYADGAYQRVLQTHGMIPSMSRKGDCFDNACAESFFSTLKNDLVHHATFQSREEARSAIFDYIEVFYNRQRLHQTLGYVAPVEFERRPASPLNLPTKPGLPQPDPSGRVIFSGWRISSKLPGSTPSGPTHG